MKRYLITPQADADIEAIWQYIAQDNPRAADRVELKLHQAMQLLSEFPRMGHTRADVDDSRYRFWSVYDYLIVYQHNRTPIEVIRVINGRRDIPNILRQ